MANDMQWKNSSQIILSLITTTGFFFCIFYMLKWEFPAANKDALNALMGVLTTIFTLQQNFFFGSSSGSIAKDDTISAIAQSSNPASAPITIPDAKTVSVKTESGDVTLTSKEEPKT